MTKLLKELLNGMTNLLLPTPIGLLANQIKVEMKIVFRFIQEELIQECGMIWIVVQTILNQLLKSICAQWLMQVLTSLFVRERSEEHTSELQSRPHLVCRLLLEKKKKKN